MTPPANVSALIQTSPKAGPLGEWDADEWGLGSVDVASVEVPQDVLARVDAQFALRHQVLPFAWEQGVLRVAISDPLSIAVVDELSFLVGAVVRPDLASADALSAAIARHYGANSEAASADGSAGIPASSVSRELADANQADGDEPVVRWANQLIAEAWRRRASDIHVEPLETRLRVRYRIDGALIEVEAPPRRLALAVISRLKIMANLSIAEKRLPQDGRIPFAIEGRTIDLRVSSLPTAHGESLVMRLLDKTSLQVGLQDLGMGPAHHRAFERAISSPDGIVLVTGPTGSGKTTTLYAALHHLNHPDRKIITVEEPVEYQVAGINQVPVNTTTGMTFAAALRAMLRQAPNVVMVGEIRDRETADTALHAAMTGHLVLSTLHTNDAAAAVTRLIDLGAKPFLVAAALRAVVAQRLVRRVCPACQRTYLPSNRELQSLGLKPEQLPTARFVRGEGCAHCHGTGYQGQVGLFEILPVTEAMRGLIYDNVTAARLRARARQDGLGSLREDGIRKVLAGLTTIAEVVAVTVADPL